MASVSKRRSALRLNGRRRRFSSTMMMAIGRRPRADFNASLESFDCVLIAGGPRTYKRFASLKQGRMSRTVTRDDRIGLRDLNGHQWIARSMTRPVHD